MASFTPPALGQPNSTEDAKIVAGLTILDNLLDSSDLVPAAGLASNAVITAKILDANVTTAKIADSAVTTAKLADANVTAAKLADDAVGEEEVTTALAQKLGVSETSTVRRGKSVIATEETRTNTAYGTLATPDQVSNVVLPTDGLLIIGYRAQWKDGTTPRAAIFLGANQLTNGLGGVQETSVATTGVYRGLSTTPTGLEGGAQSITSEATTGAIVAADTTTAGLCAVWAAAGTYTVSVQFKAASGTLSVKERKLWVWTVGF